jgi:hypothetical protein
LKGGDFKLVYTPHRAKTAAIWGKVDFNLTDILNLTQRKIGTEFNQLPHLNRKKKRVGAMKAGGGQRPYILFSNCSLTSIICDTTLNIWGELGRFTFCLLEY